MSIREARKSIQTAQARLDEALAALRQRRGRGEVPPPRDELEDEPPPREPPPREPPPPTRREPPDDPPPPRDRPDDDPPPPVRDEIPGKAPVTRIDPVKPREMHLELTPTGVREMQGERTWPNLRKAVYAIGQGMGTLNVAVLGKGGYVQFGDGNSVANFPLDIAFIGQDPTADIGPFVQSPDDTFPLLGLDLHSIRYRANKDSKAFHQRAFIGRVTLNDWEIIPLHENGVSQTQGWYMTQGWDYAVSSGYRPGNAQFAEWHHYWKGNGLSTQFLDCESGFGSGSGLVQIRSHGAGIIDGNPFGGSPKPRGPILVDNCSGDGSNETRHQMRGGAEITIYGNLAFPTVISNCRFKNLRTGGIVYGRGAGNTNPYVTPDGYAGHELWLGGNDFHCAGDWNAEMRHALNVNDIRSLIFYAPNKFRSDHRNDIQIGTAGYGPNGNVGDIRILGRGSMPDYEKGGIWVEALNKSVPLTQEDLVPEIE